jgi:hypothetical protein
MSYYDHFNSELDIFTDGHEALRAVVILATRHTPEVLEDKLVSFVAGNIDDTLEFTVCRAVAAASGGHQQLVVDILKSCPVVIEEVDGLAEGLTELLTGRSDWAMPIRNALANTNDEGTRSLARGLLALGAD